MTKFRISLQKCAIPFIILSALVIFTYILTPTYRVPERQAKTLMKIAEMSKYIGHRIAFINGHQGTSNDFAHLSDLLNFHFSEFNGRMLNNGEYGQRNDQSNTLNQFRLGDFFCDSFDIVAVGDINPDARFLLKRIDGERDGMSTCAIKRIIFITTNRLDFGLAGTDAQEYYALLRRVSLRKDQKTYWVSNNPWEPKYAELRLGGKYLDYHLIRPFGYSSLPKVSAFSLADTTLPVVFNHPFTKAFLPILQDAGIHVKVLEHQYGGPSALAQFRVFISIPYQTSTMKMYENLSHGVVVCVPTPRYLRELMEKPGFVLNNLYGTLEAGDDWYTYIEPYTKDLSQFFYQFDSLDELKSILARPVIDTRNVRESSVKYWVNVTADGLEKWKKAFDVV